MLLPQAGVDGTGTTTAWDVENDQTNTQKGTYISVLLKIKKDSENVSLLKVMTLTVGLPFPPHSLG